MKCPNCGYVRVKDNICPICNENVALKAKAYNVSARLYNIGLEMAQNRDLSGAINSLKKSVSFNKTNIDARNLLGLVYYEMGNVADALVQWIVSANIKHDDNPANEYIDNYQKNIRGSEQMEDAVKLYNSALADIKQENEDMAVISLKKALHINPRFIEALNMLTLCYLNRGKNSAALELINDVLKMDINNPKALSYYRYIFPDKNRPTPRKRAVDMPNSVYNVSMANRVKVPEKTPPLFLIFILGCVVTLSVMVFLIIPHINYLQNNKYNDLEQQYNQLSIDYNNLSTEHNEDMLSMQNENQELRNQINLNDELDLQERIKTINTAQGLYENDRTCDAAIMLLNLNTTGFSAEILEQYSKLRQTVLPLAAEEFYTTGKNEMSKSNFDTAITYFNQCMKCSPNGEEIYYSSLFQLGKIADIQNDTAEAIEYFTTVSENHPVSAIRNEAEKYISDNNLQE